MVDDEAQALRAKALVDGGGILLLLTVVLEAEWVLRTSYRVPRSAIVSQLRTFASLPGIKAENPERLFLALELADLGLDFADAVHLAATPQAATFVTFGRDLIRRVRTRGINAREP